MRPPPSFTRQASLNEYHGVLSPFEDESLESDDRLYVACMNYQHYPCNLLRKTIPRDNAKRLKETFDSLKGDLFRGDKAHLVLWEHWIGDNSEDS
jgi:hypothetical protein